MDEVATDSATRGALKDDNAFKNLRDVIKKCNKVLEKMLIRRDNKFTLFFRLVQTHDRKDVLKMKSWNTKVEAAVSALSYDEGGKQMQNVNMSDDASSVSELSEVSNGSRGIMSRGRAMLRTAGRVRTRRATPTPRMRSKNTRDGKTFASMADDGYARSTPALTSHLDKRQLDLNGNQQKIAASDISDLLQEPDKAANNPPNKTFLAPKDELVGMIRDLKQEQLVNEYNKNEEGSSPSDMKPNWLPKAEIPTTVPILPVEYIHRHRLMKQVVNSLINCSGSVESESKAHIITSITSRHADKAGNGKTTLAVAAIQSVEVRERFSDGIAWIHIGRAPLTDNDVRRLYEELYDQLMRRDIEVKEQTPSDSKDSKENVDGNQSDTIKNDIMIENSLSRNRLKFQANCLQGMREVLGRIVSKKNVLICLDDVWRIDDADRFTFDSVDKMNNTSTSNVHTKSIKNMTTCPFRILITTRTPSLMGSGQANEVFVRIFSEHEAVKLLLYAAGRRLHGGKSAPAFHQARVIVKGCGNSPLALRLAGGMLRTRNRNWTLTSPAWISLVDQCKSSLEEASKIRSFINSVGRVVDMSFMVVPNLELRASLRRCFVSFAMVFRDNEWLLTGKGIPRGIVKILFYNVVSGEKTESNLNALCSDNIIEMLEHLNLIYKARHGICCSFGKLDEQSNNVQSGKSLMNGLLNMSEEFPDDELKSDTGDSSSLQHDHTSYMMHESVST